MEQLPNIFSILSAHFSKLCVTSLVIPSNVIDGITSGAAASSGSALLETEALPGFLTLNQEKWKFWIKLCTIR
jgi:hypothetical protein